MKKTIAILLVLVIGMAGVWAAEQTKTIDLKATVDPISALLLTDNQYSLIEEYQTALDTLTETPFVTEITLTSPDAIQIGYVTVFSNLRTGFGLSYVATALSDVVGGLTRYINYELVIGSEDAKTTNDATSISETLFTAADTDVNFVYSELITLTPTDWETAVSGAEYEGTITFTFTAS